MANVKRVVSTSFWEDDKVIDSFTPEDKYFMLYLLTNPHTKQIGIYPLNLKIAAFETGYSTDSVSHLLNRFENEHGIIKRSKETTEIAIKNFLCYSIVKGGKPVLDCLHSDAKAVKDESLLQFVIEHLSKRNDLLDTVSVFVSDMQDRLTIDNDIDNDNDNDNDNEGTCNVREPYGERTAVIQFLTNKNELYDVTQADIDMFTECYPAVDVMQELRKMKAWLESNPTKRKTKGGMMRFVNNWLSKEQDKGGTKRNGTVEQSTPDGSTTYNGIQLDVVRL